MMVDTVTSQTDTGKRFRLVIEAPAESVTDFLGVVDYAAELIANGYETFIGPDGTGDEGREWFLEEVG